MLLLAAMATCVASRRAAADVSTHDAAVIEFKQARRFIDAGDCAQGLPHLEESLAYEPSVGARMSVAECIEKTDPLRAWRSLAEAALLAYANHDERMPIVEKRLDELERSVPLIQLQLSRADLERPGLEVLIDGRSIDRYHVRRQLGVEPGPHAIEVRAFGKTPWTRSVVAPSPGNVIRLPVTLLDRTGPAPPEPSKIPPPAVVTVVRMDPNATRKTVGLTLGAIGIAAIGTGAVFGVLALNKGDELDEECGGSRDSCKTNGQVVALRDNASTLAAVSTVSFIVGGAALASGAVLFLWPGGSPSANASRLRLSPSFGAIQGMAFEGVF